MIYQLNYEGSPKNLELYIYSTGSNGLLDDGHKALLSSFSPAAEN